MRHFFVVILIILITVPSIAQEQNSEKLKVFMDCSNTWCEMEYFRSKINLIDFYRDQLLSDVHVLITSDFNASGGRLYQMIFYGLNEYEGTIDTLVYNTHPNATDFERRDQMLKYLKLGLLPWVLKTQQAEELSIEMFSENQQEELEQGILEEDKWNYSARALDEDILKGLRLGVDDYITKPFNKYEYIARIYNLLKNKQEREANEHTSDLFDGKDNVDEATLKNAEKSILSNLSNPNYKVIDLANDLNYSQRQLTRVIKNLTGLTPVNLILEIRLQKSYQMLKANTHHSVSEVMYDVGIESASYFARKFKERFGLSPGEV